MDINLPLILFIAVVVSGLVYLFDFIVLRKPRLQGVARVNGQFEHLSESERSDDEGYTNALSAVLKEPAIVEYSKSFFPVLLLVFVLRSFIIEPFQIPSESMVPTLKVGDFIAVNKYAYGIRLPIVRTKIIPISDPKRGDVMVFFPPHESRYFIKRVVGVPGDTIRYINNELYINGEKMEQSNAQVDSEWRPEPGELDGCSISGGHYVVADEVLGGDTHQMRKCSVPQRFSRNYERKIPEGYYFMMGDNRDNSSDSRAWGLVPEERIVGKAFAIWMHWDKLLSVPSFSRVGTI